MKVYILEVSSYDPGSDIRGIFSTLEKAVDAFKRNNGDRDWFIYEHEVDAGEDYKWYSALELVDPEAWHAVLDKERAEYDRQRAYLNLH